MPVPGAGIVFYCGKIPLVQPGGIVLFYAKTEEDDRASPVL